MGDSSTSNGNEMAGHSQKCITDLPDELLVPIISRLPLKEAARTSVLGPMWRYIWTYRSDLDFDGWMMINYCSNIARAHQHANLMMRFVNLVNQVLKLHKAETINQFRIRYSLNRCFTHDINRWIKFAFAKGVKTLELDLAFDGSGAPQIIKHYGFPNICHPISLSHILPPDFPSFNRLKRLHLGDLNVSAEILEYFITNCPYLEVLCVRGSNSLSSLRIAGPSLHLNYVEISRCKQIKHVEIVAPNLVTFSYFGPKISVYLKSAPALVTLAIGSPHEAYLIHSIFEFHCCFSHLETLILRYCHPKGLMAHHMFPELPMLKKLVADVTANDSASLLSLNSLIDAAPSLYCFKLVLSWFGPRIQRDLKVASSHPHQCLKVIEILGFVGRPIDLEFAMHLSQKAVSLEQIYIDPRFPLYIGTPYEFADTNKISDARSQARLLKDKLPAGVRLLVG